MSQLTKLQEETWIMFFGYVAGYFAEKGEDKAKKHALQTEIMMRFFEKQMITPTDKMVEKMMELQKIVPIEQLNSIVTELMEEGWKPCMKS